MAQDFSTTDMDAELNPPVHGATLHVCKSGANVGCRYWAVHQKDKWQGDKLVFFQWIDTPCDDLKAQIKAILTQVQVIDNTVSRIERVIKKQQ